MEELLSVKQVAGKLGLSRVQVFNLVRAGKIPARKVGHDYVILAKDLDNYLIGRPVKKAVEDYGETLKRLGDG
jgi:excisionase family DNA binding protein